jgi:hypothetical protein
LLPEFQFNPGYELPIGRFVKHGDNRSEVIAYGSLKNLFGPHHGKSVCALTSPQSTFVGAASNAPRLGV